MGHGVGLTVVGFFSVDDGYGSMAEYLVLGAARSGVKVNVIPLGFKREGATNEFRAIVERSKPDALDPVLYYTWPQAALRPFLGRPALFIYTMYESSLIPPAWPAQLNLAQAVIVPTRFAAAAFRASGVMVPIEVIPDGVDPAVYHYEERPERSLTTLMVGLPEPRKHMDVGIAAWKAAFDGVPDARLIIKGKNRQHQPIYDDPRIQYVDTNEMTRGIAHWYRQADVLLALGNEGFGLPLIEGMATGLPVIALKSEGQTDVCEEAGDRVLTVRPVKWQRCQVSGGVRGVASIEDVARLLRWVATNRQEACQLGRLASDWVLRHRNVWRKGKATVAVVRKHLDIPL